MARQTKKEEDGERQGPEIKERFDIFLRLGPVLGPYVKEYAEAHGFLNMQDALRAIIREHMQRSKRKKG